MRDIRILSLRSIISSSRTGGSSGAHTKTQVGGRDRLWTVRAKEWGTWKLFWKRSRSSGRLICPTKHLQQELGATERVVFHSLEVSIHTCQSWAIHYVCV